jgi:hypothetical protein
MGMTEPKREGKEKKNELFKAPSCPLPHCTDQATHAPIPPILFKGSKTVNGTPELKTPGDVGASFLCKVPA